jgi:hypothetical protein
MMYDRYLFPGSSDGNFLFIAMSKKDLGRTLFSYAGYGWSEREVHHSSPFSCFIFVTSLT